MAEKVGRPLKYARLLISLNDKTLYSPSLVAKFALTSGYLKKDDEAIEQLFRRIRVSCIRLANRHKFPEEGDGIVEVYGVPTVAWFGWRWKLPVHNQQKRRRKYQYRKRRKKQDKTRNADES